ncbi:MAG: CvpA family protein [Verrucomicrobia bacterium]|nr:CvpA family protein [Verrucomicrobiota bacterium]
MSTATFFRAFGATTATIASMLTWLIVIAVFGLLGLAGYYRGAVRAGVSFVGLVLAAFLALPLAPTLRPLVPKLGLTNQLWWFVLPPVAVFILIVLIFAIIGLPVHHKVALYYKYNTDDHTRIRWERLNQRLGVCIGMLEATIYCLMLGLVFYVAGYPAVQTTGDESPAWQRLIASVRKEIQASGLDKSLASLDPMKENYYLASDLIGLLYQNPVLLERLLNYPAFLALGERDDIKDLVNDVEFLNAWQTKAPILNLINHPKVQNLINNAEVANEVSQVDLKDLIQYLSTGRSARYDEEKILGRWILDVSATFTLARKENPDMSAQEMAKLKTLVGVFLAKTTLMATPDNKFRVKVELTEQANRMIETAKAAAAAAAAAAQAAAGETPQPPMGMDPRIAERYFGRGRGARGAQPEEQPRPAAVPTDLPGIPQFSLAGEGTWERDGSRYKLSLTDAKNQSHSGTCTADEDRLVAKLERIAPNLQTLVFVR